MKRGADDPVVLSHSIATEKEISKTEADAEAQVAAAVEFGRESPFPKAEALYEDMFASPIQLT